MIDPDELEAGTVSLPCPDCDAVLTGPAKGAGSAAWRLGTHRYRAHGYRAPGKKKKGAPARRAPEVVNLAREMVAEVADHTKRPPTADELERGLARGLGTISVGVASMAVEFDPTMTSEEDREAALDYLSLEPEAARDIAKPIARALHRSKLNARYGRAAVDNVDLVASVTELVILGAHWRRYFRERARREELMGIRPYAARRATPAPATSPYPEEPVAVFVPPAATDAAPNPGSGPVVAEMRGVVATPAMVAELAKRNGAR